ncbi:hypothetical protein EYF80_059496 [Liparis tanakae]|uniref:Uncharacterized protein n=1 Tax=Liparis tanakae TaxID=230148 RepID=A0A4Z2EPW0_9TELE|nr:hypothetical protein EYF80_059496 [Liparis tanakae]
MVNQVKWKGEEALDLRGRGIPLGLGPPGPGGLVDWWTSGLVDWWTGGLVDWWTGGLVDWWTGGLVD